MKLMMLAVFILLSSLSVAMAETNTAENYCESVKDLGIFQLKAFDQDNRMAFSNQGGIGGLGVCWWHSRFQRNALYLAIFKPELPLDSQAVVKEKIKKIRHGKEIVYINGYSNLWDFSSANFELIQRELERWQKKEGIVKFKWIQGLKGKPVLEPGQMRAMMDKLYYKVMVEKKIVYQKLQFPGVGAHAWLVLDVEQKDNGYRLAVIDSGFPHQTMYYDYVQGMTAFDHPILGRFAPRTEFESELENVLSVAKRNCR